MRSHTICRTILLGPLLAAGLSVSSANSHDPEPPTPVELGYGYCANPTGPPNCPNMGCTFNGPTGLWGTRTSRFSAPVVKRCGPAPAFDTESYCDEYDAACYDFKAYSSAGDCMNGVNPVHSGTQTVRHAVGVDC